MGIETLGQAWAAVIKYCTVNRISPVTAFNLIENHVNKTFFKQTEPESLWVAALLQDRLNAKKETPYAAAGWLIENYGALVNKNLQDKSKKHIYWSDKIPNTIGKKFTGALDTAKNLRTKIGNKYKRAIVHDSWKEFYPNVWNRIKKDPGSQKILKRAKLS